MLICRGVVMFDISSHIVDPYKWYVLSYMNTIQIVQMSVNIPQSSGALVLCSSHSLSHLLKEPELSRDASAEERLRKLLENRHPGVV